MHSGYFGFRTDLRAVKAMENVCFKSITMFQAVAWKFENAFLYCENILLSSLELEG